MRARLPLVASLLSALAAAACAFTESDDRTGNDAVALTSCIAGDRPSAGYGVSSALADKAFSTPVAMLASPTDRSIFYVVQKTGTIHRVSTDGASTVFIEMRSRINSGPNEAGLLGFALHPKFAENGAVFFSYTKPSSTSAANLASVIARGKSTDGGLTIDPNSIVELLSFDQPYSNHNGGHIAFGKDGMLYASFGDGGSGGDPLGSGQNKNTFLGKMLRIDIDGAAPYAIPSDNPFANGGGKPEIFAWGLRNTWRFSFDRLTGDLWAGDVGQNKYEEIDKVVLGGNYGWNPREGKHCYGAGPCEIPGAIDPVVEYDHSQGYSVTGGYVYRGSAMPDLVGQYLYGDFGSGKIWAISTTTPNPTPKVVVDSGLSISSFAEDRDGELYVLDYGSGKVKKITASASSNGIPKKLSETGCFLADPRSPSSKLIPYEVNSQLWSDGAEKSRWFSVPNNQKITVGADGDWEFPVGSILVKEFRIGGKRVETRLFVRHTDGNWAGYTYEWNDAETDAELLPDGKTRQVGTQTWTYPSRSQCMACHSAAAGASLGLETAQLNRTMTYPDGTTANQLAKLSSLGLFSAPLPANPAALPDPSNADASAEERARSYLHSNCSFCHRPQGPGRGPADFRFALPLADTHVCNAEPETGELGIADARLLSPGKPANSLISVRMHRTDGERMPPIGTALVDTAGTTVIDTWIQSLTTCP